MPRLTEEARKEIESLLKEAQSPEIADRLNPWETEFVSSCIDQFDRIAWLSPDRQIPKLKEIVEGKDAGSSRDRGRHNSRPSKLSYGKGHLEGGNSGGFGGFSGPSSED